jgi:hypothetical protein
MYSTFTHTSCFGSNLSARPPCQVLLRVAQAFVAERVLVTNNLVRMRLENDTAFGTKSHAVAGASFEVLPEKRSSHGPTAIADVKFKHRLATRVILRLGEDVFVPSTCRKSETPARTRGSPLFAREGQILKWPTASQPKRRCPACQSRLR